MENDILITNIVASVVILLGATCYFALKSSNESNRAETFINIVVTKQGYQPAMIQVPAGKEVTLHIVRDGSEVCKAGIEFPQFNAAYPFMLDIPINVTLPPQAPGIVDFDCQGGNARGRIVII